MVLVHPSNGAATAPSASPPASTSSATQNPSLAPPVRAKSGTVSQLQSHVPLSARRSDPLDMKTVEQKGKPLPGWREPTSRKHIGHVKEAPRFTPTEEEWKNPFAYIKSIEPEGKKYGIVKIVPPESWNPPFSINSKRFHFKTRRQELNSVEGGTRANLNYLDGLCKFHKSHGYNLSKFPSVDKRPLDLYELKKAVEVRGGFERVCKGKKWAEIGRDLGYSGKIMSSLSTSLKNSYQRWLEPYELWLRGAKPIFYNKMEKERGGPFTPSPHPSPVKRTDTDMSGTSMSPTQHASHALQSQLETPKHPSYSPPQPHIPPPRSGFTPLNAPTFQPSGPPPGAVSTPLPHAYAPNGFSHPFERSQHFSTSPEAYYQRPSPRQDTFAPYHAQSQHPPAAPPQFAPPPVPYGHVGYASASPAPAALGFGPIQNPSTGTRLVSNPTSALPMVHNVPGSKHVVGGTSNGVLISHNAQQGVPSDHTASNGVSELKRRHSIQESEVDAPNADEERRSKRSKTETAPTVRGSNMMQARHTTSTHRSCKARRSSSADDVCEVCEKGGNADDLLICGGCFTGTHASCLDPPLASPLENEWHCSKCLIGTGEFGFEEGGVYSLKQFQEKSFYFKENHFAGKLPYDPLRNGPRPLHEDDVEAEFWRLVSSLTETVEVEYGADIHSTTHGSGFPTIERQPRDKYATDPWNLNILPLHGDSLFRYIKSDISGMTVPWLYVGMLFSCFCWHNEDHYAYSANYQHFGATKTWYGIPGDQAEKFETAMKKAVPDLFQTQPDLLLQLVTLLTPEQLAKEGIDVHAVDQRAGEMVITFPQAYHAGFNHGFNFNEAVNFAPADWEPFGQQGVLRLQEFRRQPCFSHDELLLTAATVKDNSIATAKWLGPALQASYEREVAIRERFDARVTDGCFLKLKVDSDTLLKFERRTDHDDLPEDDYLCSYCKAYSYLSRFTHEGLEKVACPDHIEMVDWGEERDGFAFNVRMITSKLDQSVQKITDKSRQPENWVEKYHQATDDSPKPQLRVLKALVSEGDKIVWDLKELPDLKKFVDRCNEWVEEAQSYITRKQQNRRKNEKVWRKGSKTKMIDSDEQEKDTLKLTGMKKLLLEAEQIGFECPEIATLQEKADDIAEYQAQVRETLEDIRHKKTVEVEELIETGKAFFVEIPEVQHLEKIVKQMQWSDKAAADRPAMTLQEIHKLIDEAQELKVPESHPLVLRITELKTRGEIWELKAKELINMETVNFHQLDSFAKQASDLPVSKETLASVDAILDKQRKAQEKIMGICNRSRSTIFRQRPKYKEAVDLMEELKDLSCKPSGFQELEKEVKKHEDWMRRGKKLFGKSNAPLHILLQHLEHIDQRNQACFDTNDAPRMPVEPSSRANTPEGDESHSNSSRDVFCLCRCPESGMMIECTVCHEWYHSRCLKIARGKVKEDDDFTCPVCDWRVKIPRDAMRPRLEELVEWQSEIIDLPFQPDEEDVTERIVDKAQTFRDYIAPFTTNVGMMSTMEEVPTMRFYLRKLEGAEVHLAQESNFFRQELHRFVPRAPEPPPLVQTSNSTRKPRPTKLQKLMKEYGVNTPEDLPEHLRVKHTTTKKKHSDKDKNGEREGSTPGANGTSKHDPLKFKRPLTSDGFRSGSTGPTLDLHGDSSMYASTSGNPYTTSASATSLTQLGSPLGFALASPEEERDGHLDPNLFANDVETLPTFDTSAFADDHGEVQDVQNESSGLGEFSFGPVGHSSSQQSSSQANFDGLFADLTNEDRMGAAMAMDMDMGHVDDDEVEGNGVQSFDPTLEDL